MTSKISNAELFSCKEKYLIYRNDRGGRTGGGVLLAVKESYECFCIPISSELEAIWCCVKVNFKKMIVGVIYRSPSTDSSFNNALHDLLNVITVRYPGIEILLMGDFNFPNIVWSASYPFSDPFSSESSNFITVCSDFSLSQLVINPTRVTQNSSALLDLILTSSPDIVSTITHLPGLSDHDVLQFSLTFPRSVSRKRFKKIRDYSKANYSAINSELAGFLDVFYLITSNVQLKLTGTCLKTK